MKEWTACAKFHSSSKTSGHRWLEQKNMKQNWDNFNYQRVTIVERNTQAAAYLPSNSYANMIPKVVTKTSN